MTPVVTAAADVVTDVELVDPGAAAAVAVLVLELLALPHPATIKAAVASAATPNMRNFAVPRLVICSLPIRDFQWTVS
jgi:hypothetical protein